MPTNEVLTLVLASVAYLEVEALQVWLSQDEALRVGPDPVTGALVRREGLGDRETHRDAEKEAV